jgi:hypothetical protein
MGAEALLDAVDGKCKVEEAERRQGAAAAAATPARRSRKRH